MNANEPKRMPETSWMYVFAFMLLWVFPGCTPGFIIENPYEEVNWEAYGRFKADLHAHTSRSDGNFSPHIIVDRYRDLGYEILAIADHNLVTYPWQEFSTFTASNLTHRRHGEGWFDQLSHEEVFVYEDRDPDLMGMIAVQANEVSQHHHVGSYFNDHPGGVLETVEETLEAIASKEGIAVLFHPGLYDGTRENWPYHPIDWYIDIYQNYDHLVGTENHNLARWDSTLTRLMPERPVWGFSNDDYHRGGMSRRWNVFLLPELTIEQVRYGMENGLSYFVHAPEGLDGPPAPEILSISVNSRRGIISIEATGYEYIEWVSNNNVVHTGDYIDIRHFPELAGYIRAEIYESENGPLAGTQPFGIKKR